MYKITNYLSKSDIEKLAQFLSERCIFDAWDIKQVIEQLNSIDDTLIAIHNAVKYNVSLNYMVWARLKGRDEGTN